MSAPSIPLTELRQRWDVARQRGIRLNAEQLCHDRPDLLEQARQQLPYWRGQSSAGTTSRSMLSLAASAAGVLLVSCGAALLIWVGLTGDMTEPVEELLMNPSTEHVLPPAPPKPGDTITNSIGMKLAWIPSGKFLMGSPPKENGREEEESLHEVEISRGFYLGTYAVTQQEFTRILEINPSYFCLGGEGKDKLAGVNARRFPVEMVSWEDAKAFCRLLGEKEGRTYRLPTEAEWEYACRAGTTTPFHFGETLSTKQANYQGKLLHGDGPEFPVIRECPTPVGIFPPNAWGLHDMHGNVWQWCEDSYESNFYQNSPTKDPLNAKQAEFRVVRGGSWLFAAGYCRSAHRSYNSSGLRSYNNGFRVVLESP